ncbi:hypothetical protein [Niabella ginsengisoli]|uniref:Uncharacterized protein n=1 Tax=Niabella ginsengisoli TaxID=522298 RepID=A0ABS9SQA5_9BACT|nr:hypothetical protein [Niabella ginsengisoli]MCH5600555.1 hypothetical protein [Niabella ginsengisoli]
MSRRDSQSAYRFGNLFILINDKGIIVINTIAHTLKHIAFKDLNIFIQPFDTNQKCVFVNNTYQISVPNYLLIFNAGFELIEKHPFPEALEIHHAFKDSRGHIWACSFKKGIFLYTAAQLRTLYYLKGKK